MLVLIPVSFVLWFFILLALIFLFPAKWPLFHLSIIGTAVAAGIYFAACMKFPSALKVELKDEMLPDRTNAERSFVDLLGHRFKITIYLMLLFLTIFMRIYDDSLGTFLNVSADFIYNTSYLIFGLATFVVAYFLRCPSCKKNYFWYSVTKLDFRSHSNWLVEFVECPYCGFTPEKRKKKQEK